MAIPTYDEFIEPLLRFLAQHGDGVRTADVYQALAGQMGLTEAERQELLPSQAQAVYQNRIGWAHDRLKRAGLSTALRRGFWALTDKGKAFVAGHARPLTDAQVADIARVPAGSRAAAADVDAPERPPATATDSRSPDEQIEEAIGELADSVSRELLELIGAAPPQFFESLVLDLLHRMGYGTSRSDLQRVGGSGDGGIDGIISLDRLGLEKVYVQAKRWQKSVGSPEVQTFMGALQLQAADKGVFLTTSTFTRDARETAGRAKGTIVLVDGARLAQLMIEHAVGVSHKLVKIPKVDSDYFDDA